MTFIPDKPSSPEPAATPQTAPNTPVGRFVPDPVQPGWTDAVLSNVEAGGKLLGRTGVRLATALPNLLVGGSEAIGAGLNKLGVPNTGPTPTLLDSDAGALNFGALNPFNRTSAGTGAQITGPGAPPQPLPSEAIINATPLQMDPNAGMPMKVADYALPFVASGGRSALGRVGEAQGLTNKAVEGAGYLAGAGIDAAGSYLGGKAGEYLGGPFGQFFGSLLGGGARPIAQRGLGEIGHQSAEPNDPAIFQAMTSPEGPGVLPTFGQVAGGEGARMEKGYMSFPFPLSTPINAARNAAEAGIARSAAAGIGEVGGRAPSAAAVNAGATGSRIIEAARETQAGLKGDLGARQDALEKAIDEGGAGVNPSPVVQEMTKISAGAAEPISRTIEPRIEDLTKTLNKLNPPTGDFEAGTLAQPYPAYLPYGVARDLRGDVRTRSLRADEVPGRYGGMVEDAYTGEMRNAAEEAGQGAEFDAANQAYAKFKTEQQPWLVRQGGELNLGAREPAPSTIGDRTASIVGSNPGYLDEINTNLGTPVARNTLADVLSRMGRVSERFTPSEWGKDYAGVPPATKDFVLQNAPEAANYLRNAATGGRAFDIQPERPGMSNAMGRLAGIGYGLAKLPGVAAIPPFVMETPSVIRAFAGQTDIPALLAQYVLRQGGAMR